MWQELSTWYSPLLFLFCSISHYLYSFISCNTCKLLPRHRFYVQSYAAPWSVLQDGANTHQRYILKLKPIPPKEVQDEFQTPNIGQFAVPAVIVKIWLMHSTNKQHVTWSKIQEFIHQNESGKYF